MTLRAFNRRNQMNQDYADFLASCPQEIPRDYNAGTFQCLYFVGGNLYTKKPVTGWVHDDPVVEGGHPTRAYAIIHPDGQVEFEGFLYSNETAFLDEEGEFLRYLSLTSGSGSSRKITMQRRPSMLSRLWAMVGG
jgi:hypothetical protein